MSPEAKIRVINNARVGYHSQYPASAFEQPIPLGTVGIELSNPNGGFYVEILDQEIGIWTNGFPGDPVTSRLAATVSVEDAGLLADKLLKASEKAKEASLVNHLQQLEDHHNPDDYPKARILRDPDVEVRVVDIKDIEYPYPAGAAGQTQTIIITSLAADGKTKIPALLLTLEDAEQMSYGMLKIIETMPTRGKDAVVVEEKYHPERVVHY